MLTKMIGIFVVILSVTTLILFGAIFYRTIAQTQSEKVVSLLTWKEIHQKVDDDQNQQIVNINKLLLEVVVSNEARLTKLESLNTVMKEDISSISGRLWALVIAVVAQLLNLLWNFMRGKK
jgi:uncharacterized protein YqgC (DUF456 family)